MTLTPQETRVRATILRQIQERGPGKTSCPSEVARSLSRFNWHPLLPVVHGMIKTLHREGLIGVFKRNKPVDPAVTGGPYRIGLPDDKTDD